MIKGLEALERIGKQKYKTTVAYITGFETVTVSVKQDNKKDYNIIEKELKALEIIKEKHVDCFKLIAIMLTSNNLTNYNQNYGEQFQLTQEEYDLLKEVLNYGKERIEN